MHQVNEEKNMSRSAENLDVTPRIAVIEDRRDDTPKFGLSRRSIRFQIVTPPPHVNPKEWVCKACDEVILKMGENFCERDLVGFTFEIPNRRNAWLPFKVASQITTDDVWNLMEMIWQSDESAILSDQFHILATCSKPPTGSARDRKYNTHAEEIEKRKGIVSIKNKDRLCLPRAISVGLARLAAGRNIRDSNYIRIRRNYKNMQTEEALRLTEAAGVTIPEDGCSIRELRKFQTYLKDYSITVYRAGNKGRDVVFKGNTLAEKKINLLLHDNHYSLILSLTAAFNCTYFCDKCYVPYNHKNAHRCNKKCPCCQQSPECPKAETLEKCDDCRRSFRGSSCFSHHKEAGICGELKKCHECLKSFTGEDHVCGYKICKICQKCVPQDHLCYMQVHKGTPKTENILFIYYDLECCQLPLEAAEPCSSSTVNVFIPNLCVFEKVCSNCASTIRSVESELPSTSATCTFCGTVKLTGERVIHQFMEHVVTLRKSFSKVVILAHGGSIFDHQNVLNYILTETIITPKLLMRGTKILRMEFGNVVLVDSLNYFAMPLSKLPEAFDLPISSKKGYFPHLFNTPEHQEYIGQLPAIEYYEPNSMKPKERQAFLEWYGSNKGKTFNFQEELASYCTMDVAILSQSCSKFRQMFLDECNVCPFTEASTIASACMKVFRRNFLKPNTIGIVPRNGYRLCDNQSLVAIEWLVFMEHTKNIEIHHAAKGREAVVQGVKVDGFSPSTNEVYEFHGCYYHGCPECFPDNDDMILKFQNTKSKTDRLKAFGYSVTEIWECEFSHIREEALTVIGSHPLLVKVPLNPRDAFYGGRTGNVKTFYACPIGGRVKIRYLDVNSLYPWVCKYGKFPKGHPEVVVGGEGLPTNGIVKCRILPPQDLYHPVLPSKMNNKLMFVLCRACGEEMNQGECYHPVNERALTGTWVVDEVRKAIEKGYLLLEVFEAWEYEVAQHSEQEKGLFSDMMDKFLKMKQEASGWPQENMSQQQKDDYIRDFFNREGVKLDADKIQKNPSKRSLGKAMLTNFWGKLGERNNLTQTRVVNTPHEYYKLAFDSPHVIINSVLPINDNTIVVNWENRDEAVEEQQSANVCIAAYVTAQARLKLYSYLEMLQERVLYYDTDSVIFISQEGLPEPPTGNYLGDLTDELAVYGEGSYIVEFVSGGPKNYAYKVVTPLGDHHTVCKVKGIKLTYSASELINFESMKQMILSDDREPVFITSKNFKRTKLHEVVIREETKIYRPNSTKRKFENHDSVPYGFKKNKSDG